jgi:hypothetical protein
LIQVLHKERKEKKKGGTVGGREGSRIARLTTLNLMADERDVYIDPFN